MAVGSMDATLERELCTGHTSCGVNSTGGEGTGRDAIFSYMFQSRKQVEV